MQTEEHNKLLETAASVLLRCFIFAVIVQLFWFGVYVGMGDFAFGIHEDLFGIERMHFEMINYFGLIFVKVLSILFFLIPWVAIKLVLGKQKK